MLQINFTANNELTKYSLSIYESPDPPSSPLVYYISRASYAFIIPARIIIIIIIRSLSENEAEQLFNWDWKWCKRNSWETKTCPCILTIHSHPETLNAFARTFAHTWTSIRWAGCRGWNRIQCWKKKITLFSRAVTSKLSRIFISWSRPTGPSEGIPALHWEILAAKCTTRNFPTTCDKWRKYYWDRVIPSLCPYGRRPRRLGRGRPLPRWSAALKRDGIMLEFLGLISIIPYFLPSFPRSRGKSTSWESHRVKVICGADDNKQRIFREEGETTGCTGS